MAVLNVKSGIRGKKNFHKEGRNELHQTLRGNEEISLIWGQNTFILSEIYFCSVRVRSYCSRTFPSSLELVAQSSLYKMNDDSFKLKIGLKLLKTDQSILNSVAL